MVEQGRRPSVRKNSGRRKPSHSNSGQGSAHPKSAQGEQRSQIGQGQPRPKTTQSGGHSAHPKTGQTHAHVKSTQGTQTHAHPKTTQSGGHGGANKSKSKGGGRKSFGQKKQKEHKHVPGIVVAKWPAPPKGTLRIIPVGGQEEVGRNMIMYEYENDIVILDMGMQFAEDDMPGIDYVIPNTKYLEGKEKNIRAVVISHGHLDHIGAAPILLEKLGYPPVIAMPLTHAILKHKVEDYKQGASKNLKTITVKSMKDVIKAGQFKLQFFQVEHSIMDSMGTIIETPGGTVIHPGDWTMERNPEGKANVFYDELQKLQRPTMLMLESLGSTRSGRHATHKEMYENLQTILAKAEGRIIIATFSSQVERVKWVIEAAKKVGRRVALDGYSMKLNIEMARTLGYIKFGKTDLIDIKDIKKYRDNQVVVICTGAQGEENAVLNRIVNKNHRFIELKKEDTVIFSSSVIPGNERSVQKLKDNVYRQSDHVIHGDLMDVHVSGHGTKQDIIDMLGQVKPDYYMPVYANHFFLKEAKSLAMAHGFKEQNIIVPDNGTVVDMDKKGFKIHDKKAPNEYVFVDGLGVSDSQHVVLRDRQVLSEDGMLVVIATIDSKKGTLINNPDIISRGFVFLKDNKKLIEDIRHRVKRLVVESDPISWADTDKIRNDIRDKIGQFVFQKTEKRPMVLPVVISV